MIAPQPFSSILDARARQSGLPKSDRRRLRLLAATARLLDEDDLELLTPSRIAPLAGLGGNDFTSCFADQGEAAAALLEAFVNHLFDRLEDAAHGERELRASIHATTLAYAREFSLNPGLFRCLVQIPAHNEHFRALYRRFNVNWNHRTAAAIARHRRGVDVAEPDELRTAYALGAMVDEFLASLYLRRDPVLCGLVQTPEDAATLLSDLWNQVVFGDG